MGRSIFIYPWDIVDGGIVETLTDIKEMGMSDISLSVSYHSGKFLLPHNPVKKMYYHPSGRAYFRPRIQQYTELKPIVGEAYNEYRDRLAVSEQDDLLTCIITEARKLELGVRAWVVGFHNSRLGKEFPEYAIRNAFDERYSHALCPSHDETRHYAVQMIRDLASQYDLSGIELESFDYMGCLHGDHHEIVGIRDKHSLDVLLGLCFCSGCSEIAGKQGVNVSKLKSWVRQRIEQIANLEPIDESVRNEEYEAYLEVRSEVVEDIFHNLKQVIDECNPSILLYGILWMAYGAEPKRNGVVPEKLDPYVDGWIACYPDRIDRVESFASQVRSIVPNHNWSGGLRLIEPEITEADQIAGYIQKYSSLGIQDIHFYNYGLTPRSTLNRLKQLFG